MDQHRFDALTRTITRTPSRRDVLRGLAALGIGLGMRLPAPVAATHFTAAMSASAATAGPSAAPGSASAIDAGPTTRGICKASQDTCTMAPVGCGGG